MRVYEELFILKPDLPEEEVDAYIEQVKGIITTGKGSIDKVDNWGVRKLAYRVAKYAEGRYVLVQFSSDPDLVHEIERRMRVSDQVIKFITVRIDEKLKKIAKRKKARDKRAARRPAPTPMASAPSVAPSMPAAPAAMPGAPAPGVPGAPAIAAVPAAPVANAPAPEAPAAVAPAAPETTAKVETKE